MKRIIETYNENKITIQFYLKNLFQNFKTDSKEENSLKYILKFDKAMETIYVVDKNYKQITPTISNTYIDNERVGIDKSYYFNLIKFTDEIIHISNPYLHYQTGRLTLTIVKQEGEDFIVVDFDIFKLLEELLLINNNSIFIKFNKLIIMTACLILAVISIFLILYGVYNFLNMFYTPKSDILHEIFSSIISVTIGISIYDLAKTFFENELLYKKNSYTNLHESKILTKFLYSIIIALSIETLMVVFKLVLNNPSDLINAFYLIFGISILVLSTAVFDFLNNKNKK